MLIYGLTGGMGSGKSQCAKYLADCGLPIINADHIGHDLLAPGGSAQDAVLEAFGDSILTDGVIDRKKLGAIVFPDAQALAKLSRITHPLIIQKIRARCDQLDQQGQSIAIVDAAIIADKGVREPWLEGLILIVATQDTRCQRLVASRGWTNDDAMTRIRAQVDPETKRPLADIVIENDGTLEMLKDQAYALAKELKGEAGEHIHDES